MPRLWKKGESGNPSGRPPGTSAASRLRLTIEAELPEIVLTLVNAAKSGDVAAARALLDRAIPVLRSIEPPVTIELYGSTLTDKGRSIVDAAAAGKLSPSQAAALIASLAQLARITELDELDARLRALEERPIPLTIQGGSHALKD